MNPKESIALLKGYKTNEAQFEIRLDANESKNFLFPEGISNLDIEINLYPDNQATALRTEIGKYIGVNPEMIIEGNGSSELLELLVKTYVDKNEVILSFEPSFSMYPIYSQIYSTSYIAVPSNKDFSLNLDLMIEYAKKYNPKLIFICTPNNPTGYLIPKEEIIKLLNQTNALVAVDEAYMEFTNGLSSMIDQIQEYPNLVVLRTMSKAFGLAGIRLGYLLGNQNIIETLNKVKSPYHLNSLSQSVGVLALKKVDLVKENVLTIQKRRQLLELELSNLGFTIYPSSGNFLFIQSAIQNFDKLLMNKGILIRGFLGDLKSYYRITVGTKEENEILVKRIEEIIHENINNH
ncbi:MAG: histidinol-phosphate transaminase [Acholeplasmataceae bacterium]|nr:histidinol-phosphate transaminase [Acholeplasmataceae bacterium]